MKSILFKLYHNAIKLQCKYINCLTNRMILYNLVIETRWYGSDVVTNEIY